MSEPMNLSDDALINLIDALSDEVIKAGEKEALLLLNNSLSDEELVIVMKGNTLLTAFATLLVNAVKNKDVSLAKSVMEVWVSPKVRTLVALAFTEDIEEAHEHIEDGINEIEHYINNQENL